MIKIKIPPYPRRIVTEQAFQRDVVPRTIKKNDSKGLSNQLVIISELTNGEKVVTIARPVRHNDKLFITAFPNPVHLFLSIAIEHFDHSESIKENNFLKCGQQVGEDIYLLEIEEAGTHECYNNYVKYRASSIIMLVSSLEAYLNHIIPNDFKYRTTRKGQEIEFNKEELESPKVSFKEKLIEVIPQWLNKSEFWKDNNDDKDYLLELYENRKNIIHLKTNSQDDFNRYLPVIDKMLDLDIAKSIEVIIRFMNMTSNNFIEKVDSTSS